ncbi:MAG: serine/threonine-protein kinase [Planctomycetia bacterium]|nr:serine/threonine-protein kinase [Planctomycetia bacterium]
MGETQNLTPGSGSNPEDVARLTRALEHLPLPEAVSRFSAGETIPGLSSWILERQLGGGGFGEVWLARHEWKDKRRAVKFCTHPAARNRLVTHEKAVIVQVMKHGKHPSIVPLLECNLEGETPWLMYEYVPGGTLAESMEDWRLLPVPRRIERVVKTLHAISSALAQLHKLDPPIVHRDLKPGNVLMAGDTPRITDFGIGGAVVDTAVADALASAEHAHIPTSLRGRGTAQYAPPEQLFGSKPHPRDDVYSLGIMAYQMLVCDVETAPGTDVADELGKLGVPKDLIALIVSSISFNPDRRPEDARVWESELLKLLEKKPTPSEPDVQLTLPIIADPRIQAEADFQRGRDYEIGRGVPQDFVKAREWYEKAAAQGNVNAQNNLGVLYARGEGVEQDYAKAREWYEKAAEQGHAPAQFNLGGLYAAGQGVPQDYVKAREWYEKAAEQNHASAQSNLGRLYKYGRGVEKNLDTALAWFRKAAANGNTRATKSVERLEKRKLR